MVYSTKQELVLGGAQAAASVTVPYGPLTTAGELQLCITLDGEPVDRSPLPLKVLPGKPDAATSEVVGGGKGNRALAVAGQPGFFTVVLRDKWGNRAATPELGGDAAPLQVELRPRQPGGGAAAGAGVQEQGAGGDEEAGGGTKGDAAVTMVAADSTGRVNVQFARGQAGRHSGCVRCASWSLCGVLCAAAAPRRAVPRGIVKIPHT